MTAHLIAHGQNQEDVDMDICVDWEELCALAKDLGATVKRHGNLVHIFNREMRMWFRLGV